MNEIDVIPPNVVALDESDIEYILLKPNCSANDVTMVVIDQINGLKRDIQSLEEMRNSLKDIFPTDTKSYRSAYIIENKVKTFTGFYQTILTYKRELHTLLFKLRDLLSDGGSVEEFKIALRAVLAERNSIKDKTDSNKKRIGELLEETPDLMPKNL